MSLCITCDTNSDSSINICKNSSIFPLVQLMNWQSISPVRNLNFNLLIQSSIVHYNDYHWIIARTNNFHPLCVIVLICTCWVYLLYIKRNTMKHSKNFSIQCCTQPWEVIVTQLLLVTVSNKLLPIELPGKKGYAGIWPFFGLPLDLIHSYCIRVRDGYWLCFSTFFFENRLLSFSCLESPTGMTKKIVQFVWYH